MISTNIYSSSILNNALSFLFIIDILIFYNSGLLLKFYYYVLLINVIFLHFIITSRAPAAWFASASHSHETPCGHLSCF